MSKYGTSMNICNNGNTIYIGKSDVNPYHGDDGNNYTCKLVKANSTWFNVTEEDIILPTTTIGDVWKKYKADIKKSFLNWIWSDHVEDDVDDVSYGVITITIFIFSTTMAIMFNLITVFIFWGILLMIFSKHLGIFKNDKMPNM
jgi:hypothetical protein